MRADRTATDRLGRLGLSMEGATADGGQQPEPQEGSSSSDSKLRELPFKAGTGEPGELSVNTVAALEDGWETLMKSSASSLKIEKVMSALAREQVRFRKTVCPLPTNLVVRTFGCANLLIAGAASVDAPPPQADHMVDRAKLLVQEREIAALKQALSAAGKILEEESC